MYAAVQSGRKGDDTSIHIIVETNFQVRVSPPPSLALFYVEAPLFMISVLLGDDGGFCPGLPPWLVHLFFYVEFLNFQEPFVSFPVVT